MARRSRCENTDAPAKQASPIAEDFSDSERDWQDVTGEHLLSEMNDDDEVKMSTWYK